MEAQAAGLPTLCSETVPIDAKVTDLFYYLPLDNTSKWVDEIIRKKGMERNSRLTEIAAAGYDVSSAAQRLQAFYIEKTINKT